MAVKFKGTSVGSQTPKGVDYGLGPKVEKSKPVVATVTKETKVKGEMMVDKSETQTLNPGVFGNGMQIAVEGGRTLNLGNYESARVGVTITVPCNEETLNAAYEYATEWVSGKIEEAVKQAKG